MTVTFGRGIEMKRVRALFVGLFAAGMLVTGCSPDPTPIVLAPSATPRGLLVPTRIIPEVVVTEVVNVPTVDVPTADVPTVEVPTIAVATSEVAVETEVIVPTDIPTDIPTVEPTATTAPTDIPTDLPTDIPATATPTEEPPTETPIPTDTPEPVLPTPIPPSQVASINVLYDSTPLPLTGVLERGVLTEGALSRDEGANLYTFTAALGDVLSLHMDAVSGDLNPLLIVLDASGTELARNDDREAGNVNSRIDGFTIPYDGTYYVVATRYYASYGIDTGRYELGMIDAEPNIQPGGTFAQLIELESIQTGTINNDFYEYSYAFWANQGDVITFQIDNTTGDLDPYMTLTDHLGNIIERADDDLVNDSFNPELVSVPIPLDGAYTLLIGRFQGVGGTTSGDFRLKVSLEEDVDSNRGTVYALLNARESGTARGDRRIFVDFTAGDSLNQNDEEVVLNTILAYTLPPLLVGETLDSAFLELNECVERGTPWDDLGELAVWHDPGASITRRNPLTMSGEATEITRLTACAGEVDVTKVVRAMYTTGSETAEFRINFPDADGELDGDTDQLFIIAPRLHVHLAGS